MNEAEATRLRIKGRGGELAVRVQGDPAAPVVFMNHSILSASTMWDEQAALLAGRGYRVVRADTRGHGESAAPAPPYAMDDLVDDSIDVLDALGIAQVHYVGLSLGGMSGFGLAIQRPDRLASLVVCDARADMPAAAAAPWPERIAIAQQQGCTALAQSTVERWFGSAFIEAHPAVAQRFVDTAARTSTAGFVGCAQTILGLAYLDRVAAIRATTTLIVGANDGPLPQAMRELQGMIRGALLEVIDGAGHLPNIDQPAAFNAALLRHLERSSTHRDPR